MDKGKFIVILSTVILISFGIVIKFINKPISKTIRCQSKINRFSIAFPSDWEIRQESKKDTMMAMGLLRNGSRASVSIYVKRLSEDEDGEQHFEEWLSDFRVHQKDEVIIDNIRAKRVFATIRTTWRANPVDIMEVHYYLVKGRRSYIITCAALPIIFDEYRDKFDEIAKSFRLE